MTQTDNTEIFGTANPPRFADFSKKRAELVGLIGQLSPLLGQLGQTTWKQSVQALKERVEDDNFKVLVMGEFNRGKSTFINAMLGQKVLPAYPVPTTAIINEVKWGNEPAARLYYRQTKDMAYAQPPLDIPVNEIEKYVVVPQSKGNQTRLDNPYEKVELFWPLPLCADKVEIIDSPGLNDDDSRQAITLGYLSNVDAVMFVVGCEQLATQSERVAIEIIRKAGHEDIFFVCNRINEIDEAEREMLKTYCYTELAPRTRLGRNGVYFINAKGGLEGRIRHDEALVNNSAVPEVEKDLKDFLAKERGRVKIIRPAREFKILLDAAGDAIPIRQKLLQTKQSELQERYEAAKKPFDQLERVRKDIGHEVKDFRNSVKEQVRTVANVFYTQTANNVSDWVKEYELSQPMNLWETVVSKEAKERLVNEVVTYLTEKLQAEFDVWNKGKLQPQLEGQLENLKGNLEKRAIQFAQDISQLQLQLVSGSVNPDKVPANEVKIVERILAGVAGLLLLDIGTGATGFAFGFDGLLKSIVPQLGIMLGTVLLVGFNPLIIIPAALSGALVQAVFRSNSINRKIKEAVAQDFANNLRYRHDELATDIAEAVNSKLELLGQALDESLGLEIAGIRDQMEAALNAKQKGQAEVDRDISQLNNIAIELKKLDTARDALATQVGMS